MDLLEGSGQGDAPCREDEWSSEVRAPVPPDLLVDGDGGGGGGAEEGVEGEDEEGVGHVDGLTGEQDAYVRGMGGGGRGEPRGVNE